MDLIDIAVGDAGRGGTVGHWGVIGGDMASLDKALRKLVSLGRPPHLGLFIRFRCVSCGAPGLPPLEDPQRTERVPAARRAEAFQFEVRLTFVVVLQRPTTVGPPFRTHDVYGFGETRIARSVDRSEVVESSQDVVVPPRWERKTFELRFDDFAGTVGAKELMDEEEVTRHSLRSAHVLQFASAVKLVQPQPLRHADGGVD